MISLVFLWHMHQPEYVDPNTGEFALPWTRLHAVKDYDEFAEVLAGFPRIHTTVNLTPVLCGQLEALGRGVKDVYRSISEKPASYLTLIEREFILSNFFKANFETMIRPHERYAELCFERGWTASPAKIHEAAKTFSAQKVRDLQVWANLAWCGHRLRQTDPVVRELIAKGRHFTEEEKLALLDVHQRVCAGVLKKYRNLMEDGIIEISTTPYYHPILPLLLDMNDAREAHPGRALPVNTRPFSEDARWHVESALDHCEKTFGRRPAGMWPAEGSVSDKACDLLASCGVRWAATDEKILERSLNGAAPPAGFLARPYVLKTPHGDLGMFFRNHTISDRIGFSYASLTPEPAVDELLSQIESAANKNESSLVSIILDGENAWEYFRGAGCRPFLTELFKRLDGPERSKIVTRMCKEMIDEPDPPPERLARISPGSWINANFNIWIGHPEDNTAWDALQIVRVHVDQIPPGPTRDKSLRLLRIAEGSDWYWWFGDDHSSQDDALFDRLFRDNLSAICKLLGKPAPREILDPIKNTQAVAPAKLPTETFTPTIDGRIRPFYEWLGAGRVDVSFLAGAMHKAVYHMERLYWGFDESTIYFCIEMSNLPAGASARIFFRTADAEMTAHLPLDAKVARLYRKDGECTLTSAFGEVLEAAVPLSVLNLAPGEHFSISVAIFVDRTEIERWPVGRDIDLFVPEESFFATQWMV